MPFHVALIAAIIKILAVVGFIMTVVPMLVWLERKVIADFQARIGPNRVGPFGLLQSFADGIKLVMKESILPTEIDRLLYLAAPVVVLIPAFAVAAAVPFGPPVELFGHTHSLVVADLPIGFLFVLALTSLSVYGIVLSGWASNNKYSLLGGLRSAAQMVSYELPMGFCVITGLLIASAMVPFAGGGERVAGGDIFSLSLSKIIHAQSGHIFNWSGFNPRFLFLGLIALVIFFICGLAETNRAPFDLPEAETELIGGYHTEYGGLRWAVFFMGEYAAMMNVAAITIILFLGGWHSPYPETWLFQPGSILYALHGAFWFGLKVFLIMLFYIQLRASLPRLRYDQLMSFSWKRLLPSSLALVLLVGTILSLFYQEKAPAVLAQAPVAAADTAPPDASGLPGMPGGGLPPGLGGMTPGGMPGPGGTAPGGMAPGGMAPGGTAPGGMAPGGMTPGTAPGAGSSPTLPTSPAGGGR